VKWFPVFLAAILLPICVAGCDRDDQIRVYSAPKDAPPPTSIANARSDGPAWTLPDGWTPADGPAFSVAAFKVSQADPTVMVTVSPLARGGADLLPNVNRWEGQLGLAPSAESDLSKVMRTIETSSGPATIVELKGPKASLRAAVIPAGERVWFVKLLGPDKIVQDQKDNFEAFVQSIKFGGAGAELQQPPTQSASFDGATWTAPSGWRLQPPKQMRIASYRTSDDANAPEVIVTRFAAGGFGSLVDNINRWRNMAGLAPVSDEKDQPYQKMTIAGADAQVYDLPGSEKHVRVAMVPAGGQVWFFRLAGPKDAVAPQIPEFDAFLKTVQFK
jgi:hypothetical protein